MLLKFRYSEKATVDMSYYIVLVNLRWRFRKILWPSQNIWTLKKSTRPALYYYDVTKDWQNLSLRFQFQSLTGIFFISIKRIIRGIKKLSLSKECIIHQIFLGKIERRNLTRKFSHNAMWNFSYFYLTFFSASLLSVISKFIRDYSLEVWNYFIIL